MFLKRLFKKSFKRDQKIVYALRTLKRGLFEEPKTCQLLCVQKIQREKEFWKSLGQKSTLSSQGLSLEA